MSAPIDLGLLPSTAHLDGAGRLKIGGCDLVELAAEYGTPLFVYDEAHLRARCAEFRSHFEHVAYASKAFLCIAMARLAAEEGLYLDVATGGELHVALAAGFPAERIIFHGNNKSDEELRAGLAAGIGRIVVDSFGEIERLAVLVGAGAPTPVAGVLVRVTPGVEAHTHEYIETGTEDSKFGFNVASGDALDACRTVIAAGLPLIGLHCHIGSQIFALDSYARAAQIVVELAGEVRRQTDSELGEINLGGGLGVRYHAGEHAPAVAEYAAVTRDAFGAAAKAAGVAEPRLFVEPGRSIAGSAGVTLYSVGTIKAVPAGHTYVAVDGGMSDNIRPATYGARYEAFLPARAAAERPLTVTVAGKHCEQGDLLVRDATLPAGVEPGDVLCTPATGAYGYAMASNYNKVPKPAVIFVRDGEARVVVRRETLEDLVRLDG